jgi:Ca-activated chloride channel family protein
MPHSSLRKLLLIPLLMGLAACAESDDSDGASRSTDDVSPDWPSASVEGGNASGQQPGAGATGGAGTLGGLGGAVGGGAFGGATGGAAQAGVSVPRASADAGVAQQPQVSGQPQKLNPFVLAASDPFSTFAADVDTASYDIFRRSARGGSLPTPETVRLEEFVNYFHYDYPTPALDAAQPFTISLAATDHVMESGTKLLRIGIQGAAPATRKPANLVFLVDVSGSMAAENKLPLVKLVLKEALEVLSADDSIAVVSYAADTRVRLAPTKVSQRSTIQGVIDALQSGGSTNGASGIAMAYEQANAAFLQDGINHVFLCTDGDFNVGISNSDELVRFIEDKRKSGVTLTALGFGERNNDSMMNRVSNAGNGIYSVLFEPDQAIAYAHQRMLSSMIHIAKDMKLQVEFNPMLVRAYRLLGYETRAVADTSFRDDSVDGGEVGAGHRVTALYELVLTDGTLPSAAGTGSTGDGDAAQLTREVGNDELVRVKIRYKQPGSAEGAAAQEVSATLAPSAILAEASAADASTRWAIAVASFAELLAKSPYVDKSALTKIRALIEPSVGDDPDRREFLTLFDKISGQI